MNTTLKVLTSQSVVVHTCHPKTQETEGGTAASSRQTGLHNEMSQNFKLRGGEVKKALLQAVINTFYHQLVFAHHA